VLRSKVATLELRAQPRSITARQLEKFIFLTERIPKIPVNIIIGPEGEDTETYALQLRRMFTYAGFTTDKEAARHLWGITRIPNLFTGITGTNSDWDDLEFIGESDEPVKYSFRGERTNDLQRIILSPNETNEVPQAMDFIFKQIGIKAHWINHPELITPGELTIFIPLRVN